MAIRSSVICALIALFLASPAHAGGLTSIFSPVDLPADKEPSKGARRNRTIVLKTHAWARDAIDEGEPWLDIDLMMSLGEVSSYFEGVEVQYEMRQALKSYPCQDPASVVTSVDADGAPTPEGIKQAHESCWQGAYQVALRSAKEKIAQGTNASRWKAVKLDSPGDFVAVFDGDETLFVQWFNPTKLDPAFNISSWYRDGLIGVPSDHVGDVESAGYVRFTPGAEDALTRLKENPHCKGIVLFSAKADEALRYIYKYWKTRKLEKFVWEPRAIPGSPEPKPLIDAVFSRSYLTMAGNPLDGGVAHIPSKNLRIVDPSLQHVVIIDDIPSRIIPEQQFLLKAEPKFDAKSYLLAEEQNRSGNGRLYHYYNSILAQTVSQIIESSSRASGVRTEMTPSTSTALPMPFAQAFRPYSYAGRRIYDALVDSIGVEKRPFSLFKLREKKYENQARDAMETARTHPELYSAAFDSK